MKAFVELLVELFFRLIAAIVGGRLINFIVASLSWSYGTIWRTVLNQPEFTCKEYLYGPNESEGWFDQKRHRLSNFIVAFAFFFVVVVLVFRLS